MIWKMQLLGKASVLNEHDHPVRFRSRSALALLVYLGLHDHPVPRVAVESLLWPDSDGDRRSQNFRRALADLRDVLEPEDSRGTVLDATRDSIGILSDKIRIDSVDFRNLADVGLSRRDEAALLDASDLYQGALWPEANDEWIYGYREELEEIYAQVIDELGERWVDQRRARDAIRLGRAAVLRAPMREEVHASLIRAYAANGQTVEAIRQFEILEQMLDDNWGEAPSARSRAALDTRVIEPLSRVPNRSEMGGAINPNSEIYVERPADVRADVAIQSCESIVLIQGPRQVGKTSLLARCLANSRTQGHETALSDFQSLSASQFTDEERLYRTLADQLARGLGIELDHSAVWNSWLGPNSNLDNFVKEALKRVDGPVLWAMDEVDRLFGYECGNDFFGLVRSWHNRRALDPSGPWGRLTVAIAYATEAHLFITDLNQSPFNVGVRLRLEDFDLKEVQQLNLNMGSPGSTSDVDRVYALTCGQPFLTRRALDFISASGSIDDLEAIAVSDQGPFGEHLRRLGQVVSKDDSVLAAVSQMLKGAPLDERVRSRLLSSGVARESGTATAFRVPIYGPYLQSVLS